MRKESGNMTIDIEKYSKDNNGLLTYSMLQKYYNKPQIRKYLDDFVISRVAKGVYYYKDYTVDMMRVYQVSNSTIVYSHETAAYLHNLTDRFPRKYCITVKQGTSLRNRKDFNIFYVNQKTYDMGVVTVRNNLNNDVITYDQERTVCDMIRSKDRVELQVYTDVIQNYFKNKPNMNKLIKYAKHFNIVEEVYEISLLLQKG